MLPAKKLLQSCEYANKIYQTHVYNLHENMHAKIAYFFSFETYYLQFRICIPANKITLKSSFCPHEALMTNSSTSVWSHKKSHRVKESRKFPQQISYEEDQTVHPMKIPPYHLSENNKMQILPCHARYIIILLLHNNHNDKNNLIVIGS